MKIDNFKVILEPDEDFDGNPSGWHVYCPALKNLEFSEVGKPLPDGPADWVGVEEISQERPHIAITV